jgi:hypothetical protein
MAIYIIMYKTKASPTYSDWTGHKKSNGVTLISLRLVVTEIQREQLEVRTV